MFGCGNISENIRVNSSHVVECPFLSLVRILFQVIYTELRFKYLSLEIIRKENCNLVAERVSIVEFYVTSQSKFLCIVLNPQF
jgi:hypothetical protein